MLPTAPNETSRVVLNDHKEMDLPPVFLFPYLTGREQRELLEVKGRITEDAAGYDLVFGAVKKHLTGWENLSIDFEADRLDELVNYSQGMELLGMLVFQSPGSEAKKKSKSE
jgi:hypothetical protein